MIKAVYYRSENKLTVEGHAHSGDHGQDLICSAASMLTYTLASFVKNSHKARQTKKPVLKLEPGDAVVSCKARPRFKLAITLVFDAICAGFELLARNYPGHVSYEIKL